MFRGESTLTQKLRIGSRLIDRRSVLLSIISFLSIISMTFAVHTAYASTDDASRTGKRVLTIYDDGIERGILTESSTLRDAFDHADIDIGEYDITEPGLDDELTSAAYDVNIYRARPVAVHDGGIVKKIMTPYRSATKIAEQAGIKLHDEDRVSLESSDDVVRDGAVERLVVERATGFTFVFYGQKSEAYTQAATVGEMLAEKAIALGDADKISVDLDEPIRAGMRIDLWREGKQTVTHKETIEHGVRQIQDADQLVGYRKVKTPGEDGEKIVTYVVVVENGKEVSRKAIKTVVTKKSIEQVEVVGAKYKGSYTTPSQNEAITWDFLMSKGLSREQTAGIMGNLMQEHGFQTTGDGLAQWLGGRKANLLTYPDPYSIDTQLQFMWDELTGPYSRVLANIKASNTVNDAVIIFQNQYEGCGVCAESNRLQYAYNILASH